MTKITTLKVVSLTTLTQSSQYTQSLQVSDIEFSILNRINAEAFRELHYQVKCREYLGDTNVAARLNVDTPLIYGFKLTNERMSLNESLFSLSVKQTSYDNLISNLKLINSLEEDMGIPKEEQSELFDTGIYDATSERKKLVLVGPSDWMKSPLTVSIYTFLLRALTYKQGSDTIEDFLENIDINGSDNSYCSQLKQLNVRFLLKNIDEVLGENPISGLNDLALLESTEIFRTYTEAPLAFTHNDRNYSTGFGVFKNHSDHGFVSFSERIKNIDGLTSPSYDLYHAPIGFKWVFNYVNILNKEKEAVQAAEKESERITKEAVKVVVKKAIRKATTLSKVGTVKKTTITKAGPTRVVTKKTTSKKIKSLSEVSA